MLTYKQHPKTNTRKKKQPFFFVHSYTCSKSPTYVQVRKQFFFYCTNAGKINLFSWQTFRFFFCLRKFCVRESFTCPQRHIDKLSMWHISNTKSLYYLFLFILFYAVYGPNILLMKIY